MAFKQDKRNAVTLFPDSISNYVSLDDPVRVYDEFIELLDFSELGIKRDSNKRGTSSYDPKMLLKVLVYSYSYGWRSSRKIERALSHNLSFIWLSGGQNPDHKTINRFRRINKKALSKVLLKCARVCYDLKLVSGNTLFVDGSKFRANAGLNKSKTKQGWQGYKEKIEQRISKLLEEIDQVDDKESGSLVKLSEELSQKSKLSERISATLSKIEADNLGEKKGYGKKKVNPKINSTDLEAKVMKGRQGSHPSYNVQMTTDLDHGLILNMEATKDPNDLNKLNSSVEQAEQVSHQEAKIVCADSGYSSIEDIKKLTDTGRKVIVPNPRYDNEGEFHANKFTYDKNNDLYICPAGKRLDKKKIENTENQVRYLPSDAKTCQGCQFFDKCTKSKNCRSIYRSNNEELKEQLQQEYESKKGQQIYKLRKEKVEYQFGHLKKNLGLGQFLLRGIKGANAEIGIAATCFNLTRITNIAGGVQEILAMFKAYKTG